MTEKKLTIDYKEYSSIDELEQSDKELALKAIEALDGSYSPYSHFAVGAAVRLSDGTIIKGANQENAAFPAGLCAERTAMFSAGANHPDTPMVEIAIVGKTGGAICDSPATPCGSCRQVMAEYQSKGGRNMEVLLVGAKRIMKFSKVQDILPFIFDSLKF